MEGLNDDVSGTIPTSPEVAVIEHVVVDEAGGVNHFRDLRQAGVL